MNNIKDDDMWLRLSIMETVEKLNSIDSKCYYISDGYLEYIKYCDIIVYDSDNDELDNKTSMVSIVIKNIKQIRSDINLLLAKL